MSVSAITLETISEAGEQSELVRSAAEFTLMELFNNASPNQRQIDEEVRDMLGRTTILALDSDREILASAGYLPKKYKPYEASLVDVSTKASERLRGLGTQIVQAVEASARETGFTSMVVIPRYDATGFYTKLGYVFEGSSRYTKAL